jgi:NodT family efflux transporter outer membrane factor (OMF) lipoprotein
MKRISLISTALLLASGCAYAPPLRAPEATPPTAYEAPHPISANLPPATLDEWWKLYNDRQLNGLVDEALVNAPDAKTAFAVLDQAAAVRKETLYQVYMPTSTTTGSATRTYTTQLGTSSPFGSLFAPPGATDSLSADFSVSWELDLWGRRAAEHKGANADFYTAAFTYEATRTALIANVANSLFQARGLALQLEDAKETSRIDHELAHIAEVKFKAGLAAKGDYDQATATAQAVDAQAESLRAQLLAAQRALLVLIGRGFDKVESLPASPDVGAPPPVPAAVPGDLLRRRPDVKAAEWRIVSAKSTLKVDELAVLPTIKLDPGVTLTKSTGPFGYASAAWSIGGNLTQPVLDRPRLLQQIHAQRAVAEQEVIAYESAVQTAYNDVETAFIFLDSDARRVHMLTEAESRARAAYDSARIGYGRGLTDITAALQAETTWRSIRLQLTQAEITLMERSVQVFKALGGGWSPGRPAISTPFATTAANGATTSERTK